MVTRLSEEKTQIFKLNEMLVGKIHLLGSSSFSLNLGFDQATARGGGPYVAAH